MNRIDHRILVHASPETVWGFISNIENNPAWQVNCRELSFLTSIRSGQGTRWRMIDEGGRAYVLEITAWYNQLGYEYIIIDGSPYKQNNGRIRLQEIAEGTIIEWSFSYELGGLLSGVRNALLVRRSIESTIVDSLWTLWRQIGQSQSEAQFQAKSLMRDAPDVEQRASYQPRHPVVVESTSTPVPYRAERPDPIVDEPPVAQDDTRPRPAVTEEESAPSPTPTTPEREQVNEPDFISGMTTGEFESLSTPEKTTPEHMRATTIEPVNVPATDDVLHTEPEQDVLDTEAEKSPFAPPKDFTPPRPIIDEPEKTQDDTAPRPVIEEKTEPTAVEETLQSTKADESTEVLPTSTPIMPKTYDVEDTSKISVFDLFGIPKPSETQQMEAVTIAQEPPAETIAETVTPEEVMPAKIPAEVEAPPPVEVIVPTEVRSTTPTTTTVVVRSGRTGRRYILRQQLVNLRRH